MGRVNNVLSICLALTLAACGNSRLSESQKETFRQTLSSMNDVVAAQKFHGQQCVVSKKGQGSGSFFAGPGGSLVAGRGLIGGNFDYSLTVNGPRCPLVLSLTITSAADVSSGQIERKGNYHLGYQLLDKSEFPNVDIDEIQLDGTL